MPVKKRRIRWVFFVLLLIIVSCVAFYFYIFNLQHEDTALLKPDYSVEAISFIQTFEKDEKSSNNKYREKIILVNGTIAAIETADSTVNVKFIDSTSGSYLICSFQKLKNEKLSSLQTGDRVTIKGVCTGGVYSQIMETEAVFLIRSTVEKN